ncbi:MAG TPA: DUF4037 domain-containing protein [Ktedonobacteraceae bacterium]
MPQFIPGLELSRLFVEEAIHPILSEHFSDLAHAAALIGTGSDVLGFDTDMSTDHDWGPTVLIFLREQDAYLADKIRGVLSFNLPHMFCGYPVNDAEARDEPETRLMQLTTEGVLNHRVFITTLRAFCLRYLAYDIDQPLDAADWLTFPSQKLRAITAGAVYHDGVGQLTELRKRLAWYPHDIWLFLLASGWQRIGQEEHLMPRAGFVGDELGSAIIASRLVRDVMTLCFLMEKQYAPYPKWFGTAFKQLESAGVLAPILWRVQCASTWQERETAIGEAYEFLAFLHNGLGITEKLPATVSSFFNRPFKVIQGGNFGHTIVAQITDPEVKRIASRGLIGSVDQFSDSTDIRSDPAWRAVLRGLYS